MLKEIIISVVIVVTIFVGNIMLEKYTEKTINTVIDQLSELKFVLEDNQQKVDTEEIKNDVSNFYKDWENKHKKLAYYIEHDELEKVKTDLTAFRSYVVTNDFVQARCEIDKAIYILRHIEEKIDLACKMFSKL